MIAKQKFSGAGGAHVGLFGRPTMFRENEDDKGGGGGDDDKLDPKLERQLNKWFRTSGFSKRIEDEVSKRVTKSVEDAFTKEDSPIMKAISGIAAKRSEGGDPGDEGDPDGKGDRGPDGKFKPRGAKPDSEIMARLKAAEEKAQRAENKIKEADDRRIAAERKADMDEERSLLAKELASRVRPTMLDDVVELLHGKRVIRGEPDKDGKRPILWKDDDGEALPFTEGVDKWSKSPRGKEYAAPVGSQGGGNGRPQIPNLGSGGKDAVASDADVGAIVGGALARR